jgi:hypothetical protein
MQYDELNCKACKDIIYNCNISNIINIKSKQNAFNIGKIVDLLSSGNIIRRHPISKISSISILSFDTEPIKLLEDISNYNNESNKRSINNSTELNFSQLSSKSSSEDTILMIDKILSIYDNDTYYELSSVIIYNSVYSGDEWKDGLMMLSEKYDTQFICMIFNDYSNKIEIESYGL